jgi:hypothetical protein
MFQLPKTSENFRFFGARLNDARSGSMTFTAMQMQQGATWRNNVFSAAAGIGL